MTTKIIENDYKKVKLLNYNVKTNRAIYELLKAKPMMDISFDQLLDNLLEYPDNAEGMILLYVSGMKEYMSKIENALDLSEDING